MRLHGFFRSSAAYRVRIGLNLKRLAYDQAFVHLRKGQQSAPDYLRLNPQGLVPVLEDGPAVLSQSLAILEYLDETHPAPAFLPAGPAARARVRALAMIPACEIHPLNNLRVLTHLEKALGLSTDARTAWYQHWVAEGFRALEQLLDDPRTGRFCHGDAPTLADICLVPQVYNAIRYNCPLDAYPRIQRINRACLDLPEFAAAAPEKQPDAE
jgi:maleylacetoacetate isomerase